MGASCEEIIALASQALIGWDAELMQKVNTIGGQIDESERTIETICMKLLVRQQPVARDLRQISAALEYPFFISAPPVPCVLPSFQYSLFRLWAPAECGDSSHPSNNRLQWDRSGS